jgi:heme o synthase
MAQTTTTTRTDNAAHAHAPTAVPGARSKAGWGYAINQLIKPRITLMVLITAAIGFSVGVRYKELVLQKEGLWAHNPDLFTQFICMLFGTGLSCIAAGIFNQVIERKSDGQMLRTASRPLVTGKVSTMTGLVIAFILTGVGLWTLAVYNNALTAILSALTIASYSLIYTPLKRKTHISTIIGAFPGAVPPVMGFTAAYEPPAGHGWYEALPVQAWVLFAILFLWQLPHFLAIAWLYKDEYAKAGLPMLPVVDDDYQATARQILLCCLILVPLTTLPALFNMAGGVYLVGSAIITLIVLYTAVRLFIARTRPNARFLFFALLLYLPIVFGLLFLDQK